MQIQTSGTVLIMVLGEPLTLITSTLITLSSLGHYKKEKKKKNNEIFSWESENDGQRFMNGSCGNSQIPLLQSSHQFLGLDDELDLPSIYHTKK